MSSPHLPLPFLESLCWQLTDIENLTPPEMLQTYERGWRYLNILAQPNDEEWRLIQALSAEYGSWLQTNFEALPMMKYQWHDSILVLLQSLRSDALDSWGIYFGGGTLVSLLCQEHRLSQDIDFITNNQGYRQLRKSLQVHGYNTLFVETNGPTANEQRLQFPRSIQADQCGVRFPVVVDGIIIKLEIIAEGRIELAPPSYPDWSPIPCLGIIDCWAEKLLANADRWNDDRTRSRDLIDLCALRLHSALPPEAIHKAEAAYLVIPTLISAIDRFQADVDWRYRCYQSLGIDRPDLILNGLDLLAAAFDRPTTIRTINETTPEISNES